MRRESILVLIGLALVAIVAFLPRIPQDLAYHHFADTRTMLGVPNALNVLSNLPFLLIGLLGFRLRPREYGYYVCFAGVVLTAFGSAWYHLAPNNATLVWDRLPMAIGFMGLLAGIIGERISLRAGILWLTPLVIVGAASVFYWQATDDLRPYALVQFGPAIVIPAILLLFPARYTLAGRYWLIIGWYTAAKFLEAADKRIYAVGGIVSGHTLKHLAAAWACYEIVRMVQQREPVHTT